MDISAFYNAVFLFVQGIDCRRMLSTTRTRCCLYTVIIIMKQNRTI